MQAFSNPDRATDRYALPDIEVFHADGTDAFCDDDGETLPAGYYWWTCFPGCLPDSGPMGPFASPVDAIEDAQAAAFDSFE